MLWPSAGSQGLTSLRQAVHGLRDRLEPDREKHSPSRFVLGRPSAYELDMANTVVDADEFDREATGALLTLERSGGAAADAQLARAAQLYRGEFLAEEPYADWVLRERGRLQGLATCVLRALADAHLSTGQLSAATSVLQRLTDVDPLDLEAQRDLIAALIRLGRHGEAARRFDLVRRQFQRTFGCEPGFALADLA